MALSHHKFTVYCDGSCLGNPGPGGWGVVVIAPGGAESEFNGHERATTNNRMELTAAIEGLRATEPGAHVVLRTDSRYVVNTMTLGWKRSANRDLWPLLDAECDARNVQFEWVRGHDSDQLNNRADELAVMGARGELVKDGASVSRPSRRKDSRRGPARASRADADEYIDDGHDAARIAELLRPGESIRACAGCGARFVASHGTELYCSHARCVLRARDS